MIIAERKLHLTGRETKSVLVQIHQPTSTEHDWACRYEITYPDRTISKEVFGVDQIQALQLAMQAIGIELHASKEHKAGELFWEEPGNGYGFPLPKNARDMLRGDDRTFF